LNKTLLLLRHAKSSWDDQALADIDRPLAKRGRKTAPRMGRELARRGWLPAAVLVSPSIRTRQTWDLMVSELPSPPQPDFRRELYELPAEHLLKEVRKTAEAVGTLLVIGHNPGLQNLALSLAGADSDPQAMEQMREKFPTSSLARLVFDGEWDALRPGAARLTHCLRPKMLK
jgi:phosphohistidine phosphatase